MKMHALKKSAFTLVLAASLLLSACGGPTQEQKMLSYTAQQVIVPLYVALDEQAGELGRQSDQFCAAANVENYQALQQQWRHTMSAWASVQPIDFGPLEDNNLRWKLHFWPDRKDITRKKVEAMLASEDTLDAERVSAGSVSVQGLAALEYLLFDANGGTLARYQHSDGLRRCELLQAIASRVQQVTAQLVTEWAGNGQPGFAELFANPGVDNDRYRDEQAALAALLGSLVVGTEVVKRNKLGIPLNNGKGADSAKPYRLEAWRSQYSLALMQASVATLEQLYRGNGAAGLAAYLAAQDAVPSALLDSIDASFASLQAQFEALQGPLFDTLKEPQNYAQLSELHQQLGQLQNSLSQLPERLGISLGFNANDGD